MKRREFIAKSSTMSALAIASSGIAGRLLASSPVPIGLGLYTVREMMQKDVGATLKEVADVGYKLVEGAGYYDGKFYGNTPTEFRKILDDTGLRMPSSHITLTPLRLNMEQAISDARTAGAEYLVLAYLFENERRTMDDYKGVIETLNKAAEMARDSGVRIAYHNHEFEFLAMEGSIPMDVMMEGFSNDVGLELDLYWVAYAGVDVGKFFDAYPLRTKLWHVKDMQEGQDKAFAEVGYGIIDFESIFKMSKKSGMKYFYVEQDVSEMPMKSIRMSFDTVNSKLLPLLAN